MKKLLTTFGVFIFLLVPSLAFASVSATPNNPADDTTSVLWSVTGSLGETAWWVFTPTGANLCHDNVNDNFSIQELMSACITSPGTLGNGAYHELAIDNTAGLANTVCAGGYASCIASGFYKGQDLCVDVGDTGACSTSGGGTDLPGQIAAAEVGMASTTGFSIGSVITWSGDNLIKLFIGSGLAVLYGLRYWIVAMLIISAIVLFSFRGMRFFRTR